MAKVTSKLQVTIPKVLADRYQIRPGDEIRFEEAGDVIRVIPPSTGAPTDGLHVSERLVLFDTATEETDPDATVATPPNPEMDPRSPLPTWRV